MVWEDRDGLSARALADLHIATSTCGHAIDGVVTAHDLLHVAQFHAGSKGGQVRVVNVQLVNDGVEAGIQAEGETKDRYELGLPGLHLSTAPTPPAHHHG